MDAKALTPLDRLARLTRLMLSVVHLQRRWHRKQGRATETGRNGEACTTDDSGEDVLNACRTSFHDCASELQAILSSLIWQMQELIAELDEQREHSTQLASSLHPNVAMRPLRMGINDFRLLRALNSGTFAHVWLAQKRTTGDVYALKAIRVDVTKLRKQGRLSEQEASLDIEQSILFRHTSPFLIRSFFSFRSVDHVFFVLEYMAGGDLDGVLSACGTRTRRITPPQDPRPITIHHR